MILTVELQGAKLFDLIVRVSKERYRHKNYTVFSRSLTWVIAIISLLDGALKSSYSTLILAFNKFLSYITLVLRLLFSVLPFVSIFRIVVVDCTVRRVTYSLFFIVGVLFRLSLSGDRFVRDKECLTKL